MATMNSRDARRRKIMERGTDRLALITGRINSLPSSSSQPHHSHTVSSPGVSLFHDENPQSDPTNADPRDEGDTIAVAEPQLCKCETNVDAIRMPPLDMSSSIKPFQIPSTVPDPSNSIVNKASLDTRACSYNTSFFTPREISSSISASENTRIVCSIAIALLVVFSHLSIPLLSSNIVKSIIATRPVYLVLLTDVTVVLALLLSKKQSGLRRTRGEARAAQSEDADGWAGVGQAMETAFLLYKAMGAVFVDCSIYAVVVICGLCLL